jgi:uncharacterized cupin superfamily protein
MTNSKPILNLDEITLTAWGHGDRFSAQLGAIGSRIGAKKLGCRLVELPPGKAGWPFHCHHANEELFVILSGSGSVRYGEQVYPLRAGDILSAPAGRSHAHQISNTSDQLLRYLAISTMQDPDITEYPDSNKLGIFAGSPPGGDPTLRSLALFVSTSAAVDYWEREG